MLRFALVVVIAFAGLAGCRAQQSQILPGVPPGGTTLSYAQPNTEELPEPPVVKSVRGVARVSFIVNLSPHTGFPQFTVNGLNETAPTIRVNPGDTIDITEADELTPVQGDKKISICIFTVSVRRPTPRATTYLECSRIQASACTTSCTSRRTRSPASTGIIRTCTVKRTIKSVRAECPVRSS